MLDVSVSILPLRLLSALARAVASLCIAAALAPTLALIVSIVVLIALTSFAVVVC